MMVRSQYMYKKRKAAFQATLTTGCRTLVSGFYLATTKFVVEELARKGFQEHNSQTAQALLGWWSVWANSWVILFSRFERVYKHLSPPPQVPPVDENPAPLDQRADTDCSNHCATLLTVPISLFFFMLQYFGVNALISTISQKETNDTDTLMTTSFLSIAAFYTSYCFSIKPMHQAIKDFIAWRTNPNHAHNIPIQPSQLIFWQAVLGLATVSAQGVFASAKLVENAGIEASEPSWWGIAIPSFILYLIFNAFTYTHAQLQSAGVLPDNNPERLTLNNSQKWLFRLFEYTSATPDAVFTGISYMAGCMVALNRHPDIEALEGYSYGLYWAGLAALCSFAAHGYAKFSIDPGRRNVISILRNPDLVLSEVQRLCYTHNDDEQTEQVYEFNTT